jgi:DNA repair protein RecO (recombination protein O)
MNWSDEAIVLSARPHGETSLLVQLLTREHGRHAGLARGARSPKSRATWEPGALVEAHWQARLEEHLVHFRAELLHAHASAVLGDPARLACLAAVAAVAEAALPEREPHQRLYAATKALLARLEAGERWAEGYVEWELLLLAELGFGLDLARCGATGATEDLTHVSPKTGRAVSAAAAAPYLDRLLALPAFLVPFSQAGEGREGATPVAPECPLPDPPSQAGEGDVAAGLRLTGFFLGRHVWAERGEPAARTRFVARATTSGVSRL